MPVDIDFTNFTPQFGLTLRLQLARREVFNNMNDLRVRVRVRVR